MRKSEKRNARRDVVMNAVILCEDFAFAAKANAALRRVGCEDGVNVRWRIRCWPMNALLDAAIAKKSLAETLDAHVIVFPTRHAHCPPLWFLNWLERWATLRQVKEAALGVIKDNDADLRGPCAELSKLIQQHGLHYVGQESSVGYDARKILAHFVEEKTAPLLPTQLQSAPVVMHEPYQSVAIND
jgi:hypothetical protein